MTSIAKVVEGIAKDGPSASALVRLITALDRLEGAVRDLRRAQIAYLADRGNEAKGRAVAQAAGHVDRELELLRAIREAIVRG